ncbi:MAG: PEGA domain-containing protein [Candidatus Latescibacteria bacterium]|jgi:hypothetical protein|nr:PEGA domain-containing protein [Candidatus Latescibacterota bacterium]
MKHSITLAIMCAALLFVVSCETRQGTLTVTTTPVPGTISIDGEIRGDAPLSLALKVGKHTVSFSSLSDQFETPQKQTVRITAGETIRIMGEYINRFIPLEHPKGFSPADSIRYYGTKERKLQDGTIFDYINGGGLVYLDHGLRETTHAVYRNEEGNELVVDIFDMGTPNNAEAAFNDDEICPEGYNSCNIGSACKSYNYEPDFLIYFHKSRYLVFISVTNDLLKEALVNYADTIANAIPGKD